MRNATPNPFLAGIIEEIQSEIKRTDADDDQARQIAKTIMNMYGLSFMEKSKIAQILQDQLGIMDIVDLRG